MNWLTDFFRVKEEDIALTASGNTLEEALQNVNQAAEEEELVHGKDNEYFCGLCSNTSTRGWVPISSFPHPHLGE
jgi:hypothetical protein